MASRQSVEKNVERPGDPEVFFNVSLRRVQSSRRSEKDVSAVQRACLKELQEARIHRTRLADRSGVAGAISLDDGEVLLRVVA